MKFRQSPWNPAILFGEQACLRLSKYWIPSNRNLNRIPRQCKISELWYALSFLLQVHVSLTNFIGNYKNWRLQHAIDRIFTNESSEARSWDCWVSQKICCYQICSVYASPYWRISVYSKPGQCFLGSSSLQYMWVSGWLDQTKVTACLVTRWNSKWNFSTDVFTSCRLTSKSWFVPPAKVTVTFIVMVIQIMWSSKLLSATLVSSRSFQASKHRFKWQSLYVSIEEPWIISGEKESLWALRLSQSISVSPDNH